MIQLGSKVRDIYTGFEGIAIARSDWLYGCSRVSIQPIKLKDGKPVDDVWFDEQRVEVVKVDTPKVATTATATSGGPQTDPARQRDAG